MTSGVYQIKNTVNDKRYIGSSHRVSKRLGTHRRTLRQGKHDNSKLQRAWAKYGEASFVFEMVCECRPDECLQREQCHIDLFDSVKRGYNICPVAGNTTGVIPSDETRQKMSKAGRGRKQTAEARANSGAAQRGKKMSLEAVEKMAATKRGVKLSPEACARISAAGIGRVPSLQTRAKMSESQRGRIVTEETREKLRKALSGRVASVKTREKMSRSQRLVNATTDVVSRRTRHLFGRKITTEHIQALANGRRRAEEVIASDDSTISGLCAAVGYEGNVE